jgi:subtilisin
MYPARYSASSSVIAVTATNPEGEIAPFANNGPEVDICAPGVDVLSTIPGDEYGVASGTSMAAPHVSAAVALMRAVNSDLTPASIKHILRKTASGCQLNLDRALRMAHVLSLRGPKMSLRGPKR